MEIVVLEFVADAHHGDEGARVADDDGEVAERLEDVDERQEQLGGAAAVGGHVLRGPGQGEGERQQRHDECPHHVYQGPEAGGSGGCTGVHCRVPEQSRKACLVGSIVVGTLTPSSCHCLPARTLTATLRFCLYRSAASCARDGQSIHIQSLSAGWFTGATPARLEL